MHRGQFVPSWYFTEAHDIPHHDLITHLIASIRWFSATIFLVRSSRSVSHWVNGGSGVTASNLPQSQGVGLPSQKKHDKFALPDGFSLGDSVEDPRSLIACIFHAKT